ncbi:MAG: hypothetical protein NVSMB56_05450 [Pyrinomonadaceae bacterium]
MCRFSFRIIAAFFTFAIGISAFFIWNSLQTPVVPLVGTFRVYPRRIDHNVPDVGESAMCAMQHRPIVGGVLNGKAISKPAPAYPAIAKTARQQGTVLVGLTVDESGKVISARAISGAPLLQQAAVQAAYQARFAPTLLSGQPVKISGTLTYNFVLE